MDEFQEIFQNELNSLEYISLRSFYNEDLQNVFDKRQDIGG